MDAVAERPDFQGLGIRQATKRNCVTPAVLPERPLDAVNGGYGTADGVERAAPDSNFPHSHSIVCKRPVSTPVRVA